jgi:hypothetical protein
MIFQPPYATGPWLLLCLKPHAGLWRGCVSVEWKGGNVSALKNSNHLILTGTYRLRLPRSQEAAAMRWTEAQLQVLFSQDLSVAIKLRQYHSDPIHPIMTDKLLHKHHPSSSETPRLRPIRWPVRTYIIFTTSTQTLSQLFWDSTTSADTLTSENIHHLCNLDQLIVFNYSGLRQARLPPNRQ